MHLPLFHEGINLILKEHRCCTMQLTAMGNEDPCQLFVRTHRLEQGARADTKHAGKEIQSDNMSYLFLMCARRSIAGPRYTFYGDLD